MTDHCKECKSPLEEHGRYCTRCGADNGEVTKEKCPVCLNLYNPGALFCSTHGYNIKKYNSLHNEHDKNIWGSLFVFGIIFSAWIAVLFVGMRFDFLHLSFGLYAMVISSALLIWAVNFFKELIKLGDKLGSLRQAKS